MNQFFTVNDQTIPEIAKFACRRETEIEPFNEIVIDSERVIRRAIAQGIKLKSILMTENYLDQCSDLFQKIDHVSVFVGSKKFVETFVGQRIHQNMMAIAERPSYFPIKALDDRAVYLNGMNDTQNVGAIVRNCHALGINSLLVDPNTCSPYARRSIRVSMGSVFSLKLFLTAAKPVDTLIQLKQQGYQIVSSHLADHSKSIVDFQFRKKSLLVIGSEYSGVDRTISEISDDFVRIPISSSVDSLNAACASAILIDRMRSQNLGD